MSTIELSGLKIGYAARKGQIKQIAPEINLDAAKGELIALIGMNGIGKSTLLRTIANLQHPLGGTIKINNSSSENIDRNEYATLLSFVSTEPVRAANLSVYQLIALGRFPYTNWYGTLTLEDKEIIYDALKLTGLINLATKPINEISDGERQRCMIARALAQNTPILILDEPTAYLDLINKFEVVQLLKELAHLKQKTVIFSTHELNLALSEADKIWLMNSETVKQGAPEDLVQDNSLSRLFGRNLNFDWQSGSFRKFMKSDKTISLQCNSETIYELLKKAMERIGFAVEKNSDITIEAQTKQDEIVFIINSGTETIEMKNIYEVCRFLSKRISDF